MKIFEPPMNRILINWSFVRFFIEIPCFFILNFGMELYLYGKIQAWYGIGSPEIPHPYWIGILIFSVIYGVKEGAVVGGLSAILYLYYSDIVTAWNPLEFGTAGILPFSFIFTGVLLGIIHDNYSHQINFIKQESIGLKNKISEFFTLNEKLVSTNLKLEKKIVFSQQTFNTIYDIAEKLNNFHLTELYRNIPSLISQQFKASKCSFYLMRPDNSITLKSQVGWENPEEFSTRYKHDNTLYYTLKDFEKTTVMEPKEVKQIGVDAFFIIALVTPEKNLFGMIKIEEINFLTVSEDSIQFMSMLSQWIMQSIYNGLRFTENEKSASFEPVTGLTREATFWTRTQKVIAAAVRHKFEVVLLLMTLQFSEDMDTGERNTLINHMGIIINEVCRVDDEVGIADLDSSYHFMILLAHTNTSQCSFVTQKIEEKISNSELNIYNRDQTLYNWEVLSFNDGTLFLSDIVQLKVFNPLNSVKHKYQP